MVCWCLVVDDIVLLCLFFIRLFGIGVIYWGVGVLSLYGFSIIVCGLFLI